MINNAHPGSSIALLTLIDRVLRKRAGKPIPREELISLYRPENLPESKEASKRFESNLDFWIEEGLWEIVEDSVVNPDRKAAEENLPARVLGRLAARSSMQAGPPLQFNRRTDPCLMALACLLAQDRHAAFDPPFPLVASSTGDSPNAVLVSESNNQFMPESTINISNESAQLLAYGRFLGFMELYDERSVLMDPGRAMHWFLDMVFEKEKELPAHEFIRRFGLFLPVLDTGAVRILVEKEMAPCGWQPHTGNRLSASLSLGIHRLRMDRRISLQERSDDPDLLSLVLPSKTELFSVVRKMEGAR